MKKLRQFDIGTAINFPVMEDGAVVPLTNAESVRLIFKPPGVPAFQRLATIVNPATGLVVYTTLSGDIGWWGLWQVQAHVVFTGGTPDVRSTKGRFEVEPNLDLPEIFLRPEPAALSSLVPSVTVT